MDKFKNATIVVLFVAVIILLLTHGCGNKVNKPVETIHDTITWTTIDTIVTPPVTITKIIKQFVPVHDTVVINGVKHDVNIYSDSLVNDDLSISWKDTVEGNFIGKGVSYRLFVPKTIIKKKYVEVNSIQYITKIPKFTMFAGGMIGGNKSELSSIMPLGGFSFNKSSVFYGYNVINQTHNIGFHTILFKSKK
jgi:hypothetical protein